MSRHFRVDDAATPEQRAALLLLALDPASTIQQLHAKAMSLGLRIGKTAIHNWRQHVRDLGADPGEQVIRLLRAAPGQIKPATIEAIRQLIKADLEAHSRPAQ
jgi:hypothetical protein